MIESRTMKIWIVAILCVSVVEFGAQESGELSGKTDHNKEEHERLCGVLKAAVGRWGISGEGLLEPLKTALHRTIFGYGSVEQKVEKLRNALPEVYKGGDLDRAMLCGEPKFEEVHQPRWSGHSAPHDVVCLCTVGNNSFPLNGTGSPSSTLCGRGKIELKAGEKKGWTSSGKGEDQITATWDNVTKPCLEGSGKGENLKEALETFIAALKTMPSTKGRQGMQLGEGTPDDSYACTGSPTRGVCVEYYPNLTDAKIWWVDLDEALKKDEQIQKQRAEEERRKQQDEAEKQNSQKAEALTSGPQTNNQTEQHRNANLTEKLRKLNLTSGTPITLPSSWLLRALLLI
ncbi:Variant surface glycoprotein [Trypanosoma congolense IL3000]|uniref:Variant surface glycoprotein n=1 Tax=Trypanosoma congolense (strain IL3000) TaxID=1068625 RepID=F9WB37_TRYCI|nr:Variant surface glycoprotein [Trypanosoma congolense IL3000]